MPKAPKSLIGQRFDRWLVVELVGVALHNRERRWKCVCDCGTEKIVRHSSLTSGDSKSCGCYSREVASQLLVNSAAHGHARRGSTTPEYRSWRSMLDRCERPGFPGYEDYGGRGILVCQRWKKFENFLADTGERPAGKTIDRYPDVNGHYEPGNCRWATNAEQARNTRRTIFVTVGGEKMCLKDACAALGIDYRATRRRIAKGKTPQEAIVVDRR